MCLVLIQVSLSPPLSTTSLCFSSSHLNRLSVCVGDPWSASPTSPVGGWCHFPHSSSKVLSDSSCSDLSLRCILEPNYSGKRKGKYCLSLGYVPCCRWDRAHLKCTDWEWGGSIALLGGEKEVATHSSVLAWRIPGMGEPGGLPSMGSHRVGHDWHDLVVVVSLLYNVVLVSAVLPNESAILYIYPLPLCPPSSPTPIPPL